MSLTPHKLMVWVRWATIGAGLASAVALAWPLKYKDLGLPFPDTVAHGLLFYGLCILMMSALPRSRTADIAKALLGVGIATELAQSLVGREMSLHDFTGDVIGVTFAVLPTYLFQFRALVREHPHASFAELKQMDRRRARARRPVLLDFASL